MLKTVRNNSKMIFSEIFLPILIQTNEMSPCICGQLFTFVVKDHKFAIVSNYKKPNGFVIRWILLLCISFTFICRVISFRLTDGNIYSPNDIFVETSLSILMVVMSLVFRTEQNTGFISLRLGFIS